MIPTEKSPRGVTADAGDNEKTEPPHYSPRWRDKATYREAAKQIAALLTAEAERKGAAVWRWN